MCPGLSLEQVDILWHCLVEDTECYDDALHWFLNQVRSKDQHAMGMETYKHLFLEKVRGGAWPGSASWLNWPQNN